MKSNILYLLLTLVAAMSACDEEVIDPNLLAVGEMKADSIQSELRWNDVGVTVEAGGTYQFTSTGQWTDLTILTDADGFNDPLLDQFSSLKRVPEAKWFELIASVDSTNFYIIGKDTSLTINESGALQMFANDADSFYFNNSGSIYTQITRTK